ncbi:hypothetical protein AAMO2058_000898700 [Amorphochlora amoebiformis]
MSRIVVLAYLLVFMPAGALQNLPGEPDLSDLVNQARNNDTSDPTRDIDPVGNCVDDEELLASLSGDKKMTCGIALKLYQDQDASCHDDLGFGPLAEVCPVTCGICEATEERRAVVVALEMIRAALTALTEDEQSQVMAGLWQDAETKGYTPKRFVKTPDEL